MGEKTSISAKNKIKHLLLNMLCSFFPKKNEILLESNPDYSCNTYALYECMLQNGLDKKYDIIWMLHNKESASISYYKGIPNFELNPKGKINKIKSYIRRNRARAIISANSIFPKFTGPKDQLHFFLDHGSQLKDVRVSGKRIGIDCDYMFSQSQFFVPYHIQQYSVKSEQIICTGLPRFDQLFEKHNNLNRIIDVEKYSSVIAWVPTFRKHNKSTRVDCDFQYNFGIPIVQNREELQRLNDFLVEKRMLLIVKPHPAQDISGLTELELSNINVLYSDDLLRSGIQINQFLTQMDAIITDYSSIYYDYLMLDRPIAITNDDYKQYERQKGFVFDNPEEIIVGYYVYTFNDLINFLSDVHNKNDTYLERRRKVKNKINDFFDSQSSVRTLSFIVKKLESQSDCYIKK